MTAATAASATFGSNPLWYVTRSTAVVGFVLLTVGMVLGVASTQRALASQSWPRFATQTLHRNVNILGVLFVGVHIVTTVADSYVSIGLVSAIAPFTSSYRTLGVTCGTIAFDILLVVAVTGFLRVRMKEGSWRAVHLAAYLAWPLSMVHFLSTGTDGGAGKWGFWVALTAAFLVVAAGTLRVLTPNDPRGPVRSLASRR